MASLYSLLPTIQCFLEHRCYKEAVELLYSQINNFTQKADHAHGNLILYELLTTYFDISVEETSKYLFTGEEALRDVKDDFPGLWLEIQKNLIHHYATFKVGQLETAIQEALNFAEQKNEWVFYSRFALEMCQFYSSTRNFEMLSRAGRQFSNNKNLREVENLFFHLIYIYAEMQTNKYKNSEQLSTITQELLDLQRNDSHPDHSDHIAVLSLSLILSLCMNAYGQQWDETSAMYINILQGLDLEKENPFFNWIDTNSLRIFASFFEGLRLKEKNQFERAKHAFESCLDLLKNANQLGLMPFSVKCMLCRISIMSGNCVQGADYLQDLTLMFESFNGEIETKRIFAIYLHSLIAHLAVALRDTIHAKNHFKRLYRLVGKQHQIYKIFSRLQLAFLRIKYSSSEVQDGDLQKSLKDISRYLSDVENINCPIMEAASSCGLTIYNLVKKQPNTVEFAKSSISKAENLNNPSWISFAQTIFSQALLNEGHLPTPVLQEAYNNNPDTRTKLRTALLLKTCYQKSDDVEGFQNLTEDVASRIMHMCGEMQNLAGAHASYYNFQSNFG